MGMGAMMGTTAMGAPILAKSNSRLPNIIFIMADDLGFADLGCTGARDARTPNIDSLAKNGMLLRQGYSNSSVCSATRTALLTGCYQYRFPVGLEEPIGPLAPKDIGLPSGRRTLASVLRESGYETALVGKWHLGDASASLPEMHGYDHFFGILGGGVDYFRHKAVLNSKEIGSGLIDGDTEIDRIGYLTDLFGAEAVKRIHERQNRPLFLSLHFTAPHWPWEGREDEEVARTLRSVLHHDGGTRQVYARMIEAMDQNVGRVISALREKGELDNSIIIFTSDNGGERFSDTWPFTGMKGELLEGGIRVPILAQWTDRIAPGVESAQVMTSMDFLPTLLSVAGGAWDKDEFDGLDLSAQLFDGAAPSDRTLFWRMKSHGQAAVRQGEWKYLQLEGQEYLFNIVNEPRERAYLNELYPGKLLELRSAWDAWNAQMLPYPLGSFSQDNVMSFPDRY